jgi:putative two-component system response regulator
MEMILRLAIAAEYKDADTGNHILRISDYSMILAEALGLSEEEVEILRYASPMHDIGKIGIPDKILQKPGKLTPEEWTVMKTHAELGARFFRNSKSPILAAASLIAESHHEKYDGSGYPKGLKGEEIPLYGRIVAIVDVFDAIVSKRCYKEKTSFEHGIKYLQDIAGTHLDPKLVDLFVKNQKKVREVYNANVAIEDFLKEDI